MVQINNNSAFSLLEILLAAIIFIVSVAGIFTTLSAVRAPVTTVESNLSAAVFGKLVLEALRTQVQDPQGAPALAAYYNCQVSSGGFCSDFALSVGTHHVPHGNLPANLSWPTALKAKNNACDVPNGCLVYTVTCADGVAADCVSNTDVAHRVDLTIQS